VSLSPSEQQKKKKAVNLFVKEPNGYKAVRAGPSTHYVAGRFAQALHVARVLERPLDDVEHLATRRDPDLAQLVKELDQLSKPVNFFCEALDHTHARKHEPAWLEVPMSAYFTRAWNAMVTKLGEWPEAVRAGLVASHLQPLRLGHADAYCGMEVSSRHPIQKPLKLLEAKLDLDIFKLEEEISLQVENEASQAVELHFKATGKELRIPCFQERFSHNGYLLDLLVPSQRGDLLVASRTPEKSSSTPHKLVLLRIPLVRLATLPTAANNLGQPVFSALLVGMKALAEMYLHEGVTQAQLTRTDWHRPLKELVMKPGWVPIDSMRSHAIRPRLLRYKQGDTQWMFKLFDYYLRSTSEDSLPQGEVTNDVENGMRRVPAPLLLSELCQEFPETYGSWSVTRFHPLYSVLRYKYVDGSICPTSWAQFVKVLKIIAAAHRLGFCHSDVLPQNIVYHANGVDVTVLDWDWARCVGQEGSAHVYVEGFNYEDLKVYRHANAQAGEPLAMTHDCWALAQIADQFFSVPATWLTDLRGAAMLTADLVGGASDLVCELQFQVSPEPVTT
jgi:hypothetical protein